MRFASRSRRFASSAAKRRNPRRKPQRGRRPWCECLEKRELLSAAAGALNPLSPDQPDPAAAALAAATGHQSPSAADISFAGFQGRSTRQMGTVNLTFAGTPVLEQSAAGASIALAGEQTWNSPGDPLVPVQTVMLLLPPGSRITAAQVQYAGPGVPVAENTALAAAPMPTQASDPAAAGDVAPPVPSASFSGDSTTTFSNYMLAGYSLGLVRVFPVHYDAATQTTLFYPNVSIQVQTGASPDTSEVARMRPLAMDTREVAGMVANAEELTTYDGAQPLDSGPQSLALPSPGQYAYVIITSSALASSFQPLLNQKLSDGLTATIVTTDYIYANYTATESHANDPEGLSGINADKIRQFIADVYANWGTRWVLLGGDASVVPVRTVYASVQGTTDNALPTDEYYACLDGPWNHNGNALWGESTDGAGGGDIDLMPDVYVGRAPVSTATETANFVNKTILNETSRNPNPKTSVWISDQLDASTDGATANQAIINQVLPASWNPQGVTSYSSSCVGGWTSADETAVISDLSAGPTLVNSLGHSNATYDSAITVADIGNLKNSFPYFMYSEGCDAGALDQADPCIAEEQVVAPHAALGAVMNTNLGWYASGSSPGYSYDYALAFWNAVFNAGQVSPGQANENSKVDNLFRVSTDVYRWIDFETMLFGDPETPLQVGQIGQIRGNVWNDANGNGVHDSGETGLAGDTVFVDLNHNGTLDSQTVNQSAAAPQVPMAIPGYGTFTSTLATNNLPGLITKVTVTLNITYPYDLDLNVYLISPAGATIELFSGIGGFSGNFTNTTLDDQAATSIDQAAAPYTGVFRPMGGLGELNGEQPNGTWTLEVGTTYGFGSGTLTGWSLQIASAEPSAVTAADGSYFIPNLPDGTFQVRLLPQSGWLDTNPTSGEQDVTLSGGQIMTGVDFATALPPRTIIVGSHLLLPDKSNQTIQIYVSGGGPVEGLNFNIQVGDGGLPAGGTDVGPVIQNVDILTGTIFQNDPTAANIDPSGQIPMFGGWKTTTASGTVDASGLLATVTIDTTGFSGRHTWALKMSNTCNGPTDFAGIAANITDGTISTDAPPVANPDTIAVLQGGTATTLVGGATSLLSNDTDADLPNDALTVATTPVVGPSHGTLILHPDGTFSYTHDGSENFTDSFTYRIYDEDNESATAVVAINITPVNHAPQGTSNTVTTLENVPYVLQVADFGFSDPVDIPPNTLLAVKISSLPTAGTLTDNNVAVTTGQSVLATDIGSHKLVFTP
ncbi:MAG: C25 family cysteine peptidase, partial [Thermoguttaceae bacterium]